ncbi:neuronal acetylcholine receptor subunit non-alpha-2-like [Babylonia areolata]|uniref:neuronal acetylcholine receptor subunit non-alpha-2-like n=1 Tax=Babylonia areolata TaxID=304850 RepID=UPI003FD3A685
MPGIPKTEDNRIPLRFRSIGVVQWAQIMHSSTTCEMAISNFPFDTQRCSLGLTAWHESTVLNVSSSNITSAYFAKNGEWEILETSVTYGLFTDGRVFFQRVFFNFTFRRRWQFYAQNLLMPIVLTSILMCTVFALPVDTGEKMGYCLTVLLSYVVFLTWITDNLPAVSVDVSIVQVYLAIVLCMGVLASLVTIWVLSIHHRPESEAMSKPMRIFVSKLLIPFYTLSCLKNKPADDKVVEIDPDPELFGRNLVAPGLSSRCSSAAPNSTRFPGHKVGNGGEEKKVRLSSAWEESEKHAQQRPEVTWQEVAVMVDRLMLFTFLFVIFVLTLIILSVLYDRY